jgi:hypothetical protein
LALSRFPRQIMGSAKPGATKPEAIIFPVREKIIGSRWGRDALGVERDQVW